MIFTVPENFEGSLVLNTLNRALSKGMTISISGNKLYAADIKMAIASGILVPVGEDYGEDKIGVFVKSKNAEGLWSRDKTGRLNDVSH